jgi:glutaredoxin 3
MAKEVKVYSTPTCPWCGRAKQFLKDNNVVFQDMDVASNRAYRDEMVKKTNQLGVPVVEIDGETHVGYDENWLKLKLGLAK